jgi:hypothetical protein
MILPILKKFVTWLKKIWMLIWVFFRRFLSPSRSNPPRVKSPLAKCICDKNRSGLNQHRGGSVAMVSCPLHGFNVAPSPLQRRGNIVSLY